MVVAPNGGFNCYLPMPFADHDRIDPDARTIWGSSIDEESEGQMRTMIVVTGVESPQIYGRSESARAQAEEQVEDIDYVE